MSISDKYRKERGILPKDAPREEMWWHKARLKEDKKDSPDHMDIVTDILIGVLLSVGSCGVLLIPSVIVIAVRLFIRSTEIHRRDKQRDLNARRIIAKADLVNRIDGLEALVDCGMTENGVDACVAAMERAGIRFKDEGGKFGQPHVLNTLSTASPDQMKTTFDQLAFRKNHLVGMEFYRAGFTFAQIEELGQRVREKYPKPVDGDRLLMIGDLAKLINQGLSPTQHRELIKALIIGSGFSESDRKIIEEKLGIMGASFDRRAFSGMGY